MAFRLGVVMDPISSIKIHKDSTFAMLLEAQSRGYETFYMEQNNLFLDGDTPMASAATLRVKDDKAGWYEFTGQQTIDLASLDIILMRKDPPFDMDYIFTTYILEMAERKGCLVVNRPSSLRDANEKLFTTWFPQCLTDGLVSASSEKLHGFLEKHRDIVIKPLDSMGGSSIFRISAGDLNTNVIFETITHYGQRLALAQKFIPEITSGDKRILLIDGEPAPYALARIPASGEFRGNLAAGGRGEGIPLTERDFWICEQVAPVLKEKGLLFVGIDVIGDYLTEVNVTSPTCIRELDEQFNLNIAGDLFNAIEKRISAH